MYKRPQIANVKTFCAYVPQGLKLPKQAGSVEKEKFILKLETNINEGSYTTILPWGKKNINKHEIHLLS